MLLKESDIEEFDSFIKDLKDIKSGKVDINSPEAQSMLQAVILIFGLLGEEMQDYLREGSLQ